jgi:hypothetical protein
MTPKSLSDYFECAYVVNLPERKDRRRAIVRELEGAGMPLSPGKVEMFAAIRPKEPMGFPSIGARGCFLSHLGILNLAIERKLRNVLVVEDDLALSTLMHTHLSDLVRELESRTWGIVYLGHVEQVSESGPPRLTPIDRPLMTSHFYAVNGPVIPRLRDYLDQVLQRQPGDPLGGPMHYDGALNMFRQFHPDVPSFLAEPNLGKQRLSRSNINAPWYEELPVLREAADAYRVVRRLVRGS